MTDDAAWLQSRLAQVEALVLAYEGALLALAGGVQSYTLETGQSRQQVTRADVVRLEQVLERLENRRSTLAARLNGAGYVARPAW